MFEDISETQGGYVENKTTGDRIPINKEGGTYGVTIRRMRKTQSEVNRNTFEALSEDEDEDSANFGANSSSSHAAPAFPRHA